MFEKQEQCPCSGLKADIDFVAVEIYYFEIEISFSYQPGHVLLCFLKALMLPCVSERTYKVYVPERTMDVFILGIV